MNLNNSTNQDYFSTSCGNLENSFNLAYNNQMFPDFQEEEEGEKDGINLYNNFDSNFPRNNLDEKREDKNEELNQSYKDVIRSFKEIKNTSQMGRIKTRDRNGNINLYTGKKKSKDSSSIYNLISKVNRGLIQDVTIPILNQQYKNDEKIRNKSKEIFYKHNKGKNKEEYNNDIFHYLSLNDTGIIKHNKENIKKYLSSTIIKIIEKYPTSEKFKNYPGDYNKQMIKFVYDNESDENAKKFLDKKKMRDILDIFKDYKKDDVNNEILKKVKDECHIDLGKVENLKTFDDYLNETKEKINDLKTEMENINKKEKEINSAALDELIERKKLILEDLNELNKKLENYEKVIKYYLSMNLEDENEINNIK